MAMNRGQKVLERHFRHWRDNGLLGAELEERLRQSSRELERSGVSTVFRTALAVLGSLLVLAGLILVVAENWMALHRGVKLAGWAALLGLFLAASVELDRRFPGRPALAEAFALLAGGWVLAGIALVGQIYHLTARTPNGYWLWLALILPAAWLLPRRAVAAVAFVAMVSALGSEVLEPRSLVHSSTSEGPWLWLAIPLLGGAVVSALPRRLPHLRSWLGLWVFGAGQLFLLVLGATKELDESGLGAAWVVAAAGIAAALALPDRVLPWDATTSRAVLVATLLPWALIGREYARGDVLDNFGLGVAWVAQLAVAALVIRAGARAGSPSWVNLGYIALLAGVVVRYFDLFGDYLEGGIALTLTGGLLLFVLFVLEKARRRTLTAEAVA
jgi:uncharacterized membrane protein